MVVFIIHKHMINVNSVVLMDKLISLKITVIGETQVVVGHQQIWELMLTVLTVHLIMVIHGIVIHVFHLMEVIVIMLFITRHIMNVKHQVINTVHTSLLIRKLKDYISVLKNVLITK